MVGDEGVEDEGERGWWDSIGSKLVRDER